MKADASSLRMVDPDSIEQNPDNPRLIFHEDEMNRLLESIREVGIKVPLSVYEKGNKFVLIDGERRWRCARKLNLAEVPAITQPEPSPLQNILTMFNIHNVRQAWDLMPMAIKLAQVRDMLVQENTSAKARDLAGLTGLPVTTVNRAFELLELPERLASDRQPTLTRREEEIATCVARGLTNRQIAQELSISEHTVATHVGKIMRKLGLSSRSQLAAWVTEQGLPTSDSG